MYIQYHVIPIMKAIIHHHAQQNNDLTKQTNRILLIHKIWKNPQPKLGFFPFIHYLYLLVTIGMIQIADKKYLQLVCINYSSSLD